MVRISNEKKEDNRRKLMEAAATEFARYGLERANINRISTSAGFGKGTVYNYFSSKEELFLEIIKTACTLAVEDAASLSETASTRECLLTIVRSDMAWINMYEDFARVMLRELVNADPRFYPQIVEASAPYIQKISQILSDGVKKGEIRSDVPCLQLAMLFVGISEILLIQYWGSDKIWPALEAIPEICVNQFLEGAAFRKED